MLREIYFIEAACCYCLNWVLFCLCFCSLCLVSVFSLVCFIKNMGVSIILMLIHFCFVLFWNRWDCDLCFPRSSQESRFRYLYPSGLLQYRIRDTSVQVALQYPSCVKWDTMHWEILSDIFISKDESAQTVLSIDVWHFKSAWWHHCPCNRKYIQSPLKTRKG